MTRTSGKVGHTTLEGLKQCLLDDHVRFMARPLKTHLSPFVSLLWQQTSQKDNIAIFEGGGVLKLAGSIRQYTFWLALMRALFGSMAWWRSSASVQCVPILFVTRCTTKHIPDQEILIDFSHDEFHHNPTKENIDDMTCLKHGPINERAVISIRWELIMAKVERELLKWHSEESRQAYINSILMTTQNESSKISMSRPLLNETQMLYSGKSVYTAIRTLNPDERGGGWSVVKHVIEHLEPPPRDNSWLWWWMRWLAARRQQVATSMAATFPTPTLFAQNVPESIFAQNTPKPIGNNKSSNM